MDAPTPDCTVDVTIIGGGPTGLAAAYYAGHREASVRILDTLPELGGQVMAMYPEKHIFDVAGHPKIKASELCRLQVEQAMQFSPDVHLETNAETIRHVPAGGGEEVDQLIELVTGDGRAFRTRTMIITAGHGAFEPRRLPIEGIDEWAGRGLSYMVKRTADFEDKHVVIVGGGDSALDWTLGLHGIAKGITLVHRRDRFRAMEHSVSRMRSLVDSGGVALEVPCEVTEVHGNGRVEAVTITNSESGTAEIVECDSLVTLLGFKSALGSIANWGLDFHSKKQVTVDPHNMETNLPGVYAAGDVAGYDGKITLITIGMGEAAIAANRAITYFRPSAKAQPKYSTE